MANRGAVVYTEPTDVGKGDIVRADSTKYLLSVLLVTMNERDSIDRIRNNPDNYGGAISQLSGIADISKQNEMNSVRASIDVNQPVYASWVNTIIKYTNEMVNTCGGQSASVATITCQFPYNATIEKISAQGTALVVDSVTGDQAIDPTTQLAIGYVTPDSVPTAVLDANGAPTYYTSGSQRYTAVVTANGTSKTYYVLYTPSPTAVQTARLCGNPSLACPNRSSLYDWINQASAADPGFVYVCNNVLRQVIVYGAGSIAASPIPSVSPGDLVMANTFDNITTNLRLISSALDSYKSWWNNGNCALTCQVSCQRACMIACQSCYSGTCHNQNCGGWS